MDPAACTLCPARRLTAPLHRPVHPRSSASRAGACSRPVGRPGGSDPESSVPADELRASSSRAETNGFSSPFSPTLCRARVFQLATLRIAQRILAP
jgi:hypothetical protein